MARIRSIKPEFFTSPDTAKATVDARLFYIALWCWADDWGIGEANFTQLLGFAFPEEDQRERKEVQSLCKEVANTYGTVFYENDGRYFYAIPSWDDHQKTQRRAQRRNPSPDDMNSRPDLRIYEEPWPSESTQGSSESTQGNHEEGTGEQGNRGTGEHVTIAQITSTTENTTTPPRTSRASDDAHNTDERFALFWDTYPIKRDKKRAHKAFMKALNRADMDTIMAGAKQYRDDPNREIAFTKYAEGWLNGDGWDDDPLPPRTTTSTDQRRTENLNRLSNYQPWDPNHQQPEQWGNPETRAIGH